VYVSRRHSASKVYGPVVGNPVVGGETDVVVTPGVTDVVVASGGVMVVGGPDDPGSRTVALGLARHP
jgi:hypothetical protein